MLARFLRAAGELGVRAAGASDGTSACRFVETAVVGLPAGVVGLGLTAAGLASQRALHIDRSSAGAVARVTSLDGDMMISRWWWRLRTLCSRCIPSGVQVALNLAWQLKAQ